MMIKIVYFLIAIIITNICFVFTIAAKSCQIHQSPNNINLGEISTANLQLNTDTLLSNYIINYVIHCTENVSNPKLIIKPNPNHIPSVNNKEKNIFSYLDNTGFIFFTLSVKKINNNLGKVIYFKRSLDDNLHLDKNDLTSEHNNELALYLMAEDGSTITDNHFIVSILISFYATDLKNIKRKIIKDNNIISSSMNAIFYYD